MRQTDIDPNKGQRGAALFVVTMLLLLCGLAVLSAARIGQLNESLIGNTADHARAFAAAEALMRDAETDVLGLLADGAPCKSGPAFSGCRQTAGAVFFPQDPGDMDRLTDAVAGFTDLPCSGGICAPSSLEQLENVDKTLALADSAKRSSTAFARYGQFTAPDPGAAGVQRNPYLARNAWYWVEVFSYPIAAGIADGSRYQPDADRPFIFRITAVVLGNKPGTRAVLRQVFIPAPLASNP